MNDSIIVSASKFSLTPSNKDFWQRVRDLVKQSSESGTRVLTLPEYASLAWAQSKLGPQSDFRSYIDFLVERSSEYTETMESIAREKNIVLVAGTVFYPGPLGTITNTAPIVGGQKHVLQPKNFLTRFEEEIWKIQSPSQFVFNPFEVDGSRFATLICFDSEFAALSLLCAEHETDVLLVPSCTSSAHGYNRVRICTQARTIENQLYAVVSGTIGRDSIMTDIDMNYTVPGLFSPIDEPLNSNGIIKEGNATDKDEIITSTLDLNLLANLRKNGRVLNLKKWKERSK